MKNTNYRKTQARQFLKYEKLTEITDISDLLTFTGAYTLLLQNMGSKLSPRSGKTIISMMKDISNQ